MDTLPPELIEKYEKAQVLVGRPVRAYNERKVVAEVEFKDGDCCGVQIIVVFTDGTYVYLEDVQK